MFSVLKKRGGSSGIILVSLLAISGFFLWSYWAEIDTVSRATGQVIPTGRVQVIQSSDGGVIEEMLVKEGDRVKKGQKLVALDQVKIQAAVNEVSAKVASSKTIKARIEAELFDKALIFPKDVSGYKEFIENQSSLYRQRRQSLKEDINTQTKLLEYLRQELQMNLPLLEKGDVSRSTVLALQRSVADAEGKLNAIKNKYLQDLQTEYAKVEEELKSNEQLLTQRKSSLEASILYAPVDGIVKNIKFTTIGAVISQGGEVMQIVPTEDEMIVESKVSPTDIAYIRNGQDASIRFDAYDSSIYGSGDGKVIYISPDTLTEQKATGEQIYYRVHIRVSTNKMRPKPGEKIELQPGMTATAEIKTGRNTVLNFLMKPITKTVSQSFGER